MNLDAATNEQGGVARGVACRPVGRDLEAVAGDDGLAVGGEGFPAVKFLSRDPVGQPQGIDGSGEGDHREVRQHQETVLGRGGADLGRTGWNSGLAHKLLVDGIVRI